MINENVKERPIKKDSKNSTRKVNGGKFWDQTHPPSKFRWNLLSGFYVILLTNQPTNGQEWKHKRLN